MTRVGAGCSLIRLERHVDERGMLAVLDEGTGLPFLPVRVFVVTDVPAGFQRGGHAHRGMSELLIAAAGAVTVEVDDGVECATIVLDAPGLALHVPPRVWCTQTSFSVDATLVVLASRPYDPDDYIRERSELRGWDVS